MANETPAPFTAAQLAHEILEHLNQNTEDLCAVEASGTMANPACLVVDFIDADGYALRTYKVYVQAL